MLWQIPLACISTGVLLFAALTGGAAATTSPRANAPVRFLGYSFSVPANWRVISLAQHPSTCVRFDRHVLYLGIPSPNESCPSSVIGTTESMLIEPGPRRAAMSAAEDTVTRRITVTGPRVRITATFGTRAAEIKQILVSAGLPPPGTSPAGAAEQRDAASPGLATEASSHALDTPAIPALPYQATDYQGLGFDTCAAPSEATMQAWGKSPYRAVGVYIGGSDAACAQPNLTAGWLSHEAAAGWHFIPLYVGPQAAFGELGSSAASQGAAAAVDAAHQAGRLGFGPLTPIYYDMEAYPPSDSARALAFESAWTTTLHQLGYSSGVYSSSSSGIADLVHQYGRGTYTMPDVIFDALWNGQANAVDSVFGTGEWRPHLRLHQYSGNVVQTYGGVTIQIDQDYLNVLLPGPAGTPTATQAVTRSDWKREVFYRGAGGGLWYLRRVSGQDWAQPTDLGGALYCQPSAVLSSTGHTLVFYRGADGQLWQVSSTSSTPSGWSAAQPLPALGTLGGRPWVVSEPSGVIDVFWRNFSDSSLWYAEDTPGQGWSSPVRLAGGLTSAPSPAVSSPGVVQVFWKGGDGGLWQATRDKAGQWGSPVRVGMGPLEGWPHATAQPDGDVEVFWRHGSALLGASLAKGHWTGPFSLGRETAQSPPVPVTANGLVHVLFVGGNGGLWQSVRTAAGQWLKPVQLVPGPLATLPGREAALPFAAIDPARAGIDVFWRGPDQQLWWTAISGSGQASTPRNLG